MVGTLEVVCCTTKVRGIEDGGGAKWWHHG